MLARAVVIGLLLATAAGCRGEDAATGVPDPLGLGERLALIDWLRERGEPVEPGTELEPLRVRYRAATGQDGAAGAAAEREAAVLALWRGHGVVGDASASVEQLRARLAELDAVKAGADAAERQRQLAAANSPDLPWAAALPGTSAGVSEPARQEGATARAKPAPALAEVREIQRPRDMGDGVRAFLISPDRSPILLVVCDADLMGLMEVVLPRWPAEERLAAGVDGAIIIHAHSDGGNFNRAVVAGAQEVGGDLAAHLRRNREYYETMAGTRARRNLDMAAMTGCNFGGFNQDAQLRDGLGYRPTHRAFTVPNHLDAGIVCLPAIHAAGSTPFDRMRPLHARFTFAEKLSDSDGKAHPVACYAVVDEAAVDPNNALRRFVVARDGGMVEQEK